MSEMPDECGPQAPSPGRSSPSRRERRGRDEDARREDGIMAEHFRDPRNRSPLVGGNVIPVPRTTDVAAKGRIPSKVRERRAKSRKTGGAPAKVARVAS